MKIKRLFALTVCLGSALSLSGCQKESNITKVATLKTVDGLNLYLTANAKGKVSNSYLYLNDKNTLEEYAKEVYDKANNKRPNCDVAFFPVNTDENVNNGLKKLFEFDKDTKYFKIVYVDSFSFTTNKTFNEITGVWVGRQGWIDNKNGTGRKFIDGLAKAADYRMSTMLDKDGKDTGAINSDYKMAHADFKDQPSFSTFKEMYTFMEEKYNQNKLPDYVFNDKNDKIVNYKSIYEYCALFALQNKGVGQPFNNTDVLNNFINTSARDDGNPFINNDTSKELFGSLKDIGKTSTEDKEVSDNGKDLLTKLATKAGVTYDDRVELKLMRHGNAHCNDASSSGDMKKVILISSIGGAAVLAIVILLIIRRIKTGKKLFDVKKALDADIDPDDPKVVNRKKVGEDLKNARIKLGMSIKDAAYIMRMPENYLETIIETGEIFVPKKLRARLIVCYKLPKDYFKKAYKEDKK